MNLFNEEALEQIIINLYPQGAECKKSNETIIVTPGCNHALPDLTGVLRFEFYNLNKPEQYLEKKGNWISKNYINWNPLPPVKARVYASKGVQINNHDEVVISPNSSIDCPLDFKNQLLNPLRTVAIGNGTFAGERTKIITTEYDRESDCLTVGPVHVGRKCVTAGDTTLHPGTILGNNCILGALEETQGVIPEGSVISHTNYGKNKLPYSLGTYHYRLFKTLSSATDRLKKGTYKNKDLVISKSNGGYNISILPEENAKNIITEYSRDNLYKIIMQDNLLSGTFLNMDANWKKAFESNNVFRMFNTRICMGLAKLILMPSIVRNSLYALGEIHVGENTSIGKFTAMGYLNSDLIYIGNNVNIGRNVIIADHYYTAEGLKRGIVYIDDDCVIGDNSFVAPCTYLSKGFKVKEKEVIQGVHL